MRINNNKLNYLVYILVFCVAIAAVGGYFLGNSLTDYVFIEVERNNDSSKNNLNVIDIIDMDTDANIDKVAMEVNNIVSFLSGKSISDNEACNALKSGNVNSFNSIVNGNFLNVVAPYYYACDRNIKYEISDGKRLMSESDYQEYKNYFNDTLLSLDELVDSSNPYYGKKYYVAYEEQLIKNSEFTYEYVKDIQKNEDKYIVTIVINNKNTNNKLNGKIVMSFNDDHLYYESFSIN